MKKFAMPSKEEMKARFWELHDALDATRAKAAPLREAHDAFVNEAREKAEAMHKQILDVEADVIGGLNLFDAQMEQAAIARALGNNPGPRPE